MHSHVESNRVRPLVIVLSMLMSLIITPTPARAQATNNVTLVSALPPLQIVGATTSWAAVPTSPSDTLVYQFSVAALDDEFQIVRDFNLYPFFQWTPLEEGIYQIRAVMKDRTTGETWSATEIYGVLPLVSGGQRLVTDTLHPLVALYSRPSCANGYVRIRYRAESELFWQYTDWRPCQAGKSLNIYVGGMRANTTYQMQDELLTISGVQRSGSVFHTTGLPNVDFPTGTVVDPIDNATSLLDNLLLVSPLFGEDEILNAFPYITDVAGRPIWYYSNLQNPWHIGAYLMRPVYGGTMLLTVTYIDANQILREIDLVGNILRETNTTEINEHLVAMGEDPILSFHHDALRLENGHTLVLANSERFLEDVQGPGSVSILGDVILELDENFQVQWVWNSFEKLDVTRAAVLNEICIPDGLECAGETVGPDTRDWTHANSIDYSPYDGNIIMSMRHQDWVIKIDYQDGAGSGDVIWRLGAEGDFAIDSDDPWPWFSHQHYARYWAEDSLVLFDNGNTRCESQPQPCNSRGQVYTLDETNLTASLDLNVDLGIYTPAWGEGSRLTNGNYHFSASRGGPLETRSIEVTPDGSTVYRFDTEIAAYRSLRMFSLYVPELNPVYVASVNALATLPVGAVEEWNQFGSTPIYMPYINAGSAQAQ